MNALRSLLLASALLAGCGSAETTTPRDAGATADADAGPSPFCKQVEARAITCLDDWDPRTCAALEACVQAIVRAEEREPIVSCLTARACDATEDRCWADAAGKYATDPAVTAYVKACTEKRTACADAFSADVCGPEFGVLRDDLRPKVSACLGKPCGDVADCHQAALQSAGCLR